VTAEPVQWSRGATSSSCRASTMRAANLTFVEGASTSLRRAARLLPLRRAGRRNRRRSRPRELQQLVIAINGSFDVLVDDGETRRVVQLNAATRAC